MDRYTGQDIEIIDVGMCYEGSEKAALSNINVHIKAGEFFSFLGPSGCGKTTLLRLIAGFLEPTTGQVLIGGKNMRGIGSNKRPTAMIFQNLALFTLMTVAENVGFGLEMRGVSSDKRRKKVDELLELVDLPGVGKKNVSDLSGGQMQRVAIARGLAVEPSVLLLDEPLSALDLKLRQHMRTELRQIQERTGVTFIYITHDQGEALTMSDRVGVMSANGTIEQIATAENLYNKPDTAFVANFVGENNSFTATVKTASNGHATVETSFGLLKGINPQQLSSGQQAVAFIRPEVISVLEDSKKVENTIKCRVKNISFEGAFVTIFLDLEGEDAFIMRQHNDGTTIFPEIGSAIDVCFGTQNTRLLAVGEGFHA
ncbi:MAG: ABC transporter ATP-binding protein [Desulfocapsa sp.]|uniref:ABC transporter ATP-binding protein n=1 Tax=Desulfotalea psychrophila TaxID=84980 RepID=A0ABS3AVV4_9BACT|nr:ABC transporter ATP-binding protein [Desulfocapsa sp.]MBN4048708.1 ABC transporter ATP-binding protein [bacterium AH-315-N22]MBN4058784.1 ABC transporter ATP-binding protein [Desulfocapsa sp. AH-315-J15]MBN4068884.1 ABC transporter ATP-binding protein [Desulfotalea psychrophila]